MRPVVFGSCRGWLEQPSEGLPLRDGIVIFGAYGVEDLSTRYSLARLAARLAEVGHPVLRFDLPGTGDSLGDWQDPGQLPAWVAAGRAAIDALRGWSGVSSVSLIGLRLGGMVAALVAQALRDSDSPVSDLVLLGPVIQGRQYIRELRALSNGSSSLNVAGFSMSEETQAAITEVDICTFVKIPAGRIFLGVPGASKAMNRLQEQWGAVADVCCVPYPDMAQHIGETATNFAPSGMFDQLVDWLAVGGVKLQAKDQNLLLHEVEPSSNTVIGTANLSAAGFIEHGAIIPAQANLAGVWCLPDENAIPSVLVIFCSSGLNPHVGGARGWVHLARHLAREGVGSLRFDLAGMGDSPPLSNAPSELVYHSVGIPQLRAVIDYVEGAMAGSSVCVVGICSGGFLAFHEATIDRRVAGLVLANVQCFIWHDGMSLQEVASLKGRSKKVYLQRVFQPETWQRLIGGQIDVLYLAKLLARSVLCRIRGFSGKIFVREMPHKGDADKPMGVTSIQDSICQGFAVIANRGTRIAVVYGDKDVGLDEFERYYGPSCRKYLRLPHAKLAVLTEFDHDVHEVAAQNKLYDEIWMVCNELLENTRGPRERMF